MLRAFLPILFCFASFFASAQFQPVKWSFAAERISDAEYNIVITADIENGWSVYSQFLESDLGPIPTSFEFYTNDAIQLVGKTIENGYRKESYDHLFDMKLVKFSKKAKFIQRVKIKDRAQSIKGQLTYMTCDESSCLPPANLNFDIA
ncbi:MAG: protein-disulfide reductase DsbD domain-containing protein, partial [Bacteroidota bacterium]